MNRKEIVKEFLLQASKGNVEEVFDQFIDDDFKHHNVYFKGDKQSLKQAMKVSGIQSPQRKMKIHRVLEDGDLLAVHSHIQQDDEDRGAAVVHLFRFRGNKIIEMWDIGQAIPEEIENEHGMF